MLINLGHGNTILNEWVKEIRCSSTQTDRMRFRRNMERIGEISAYEISKTLTYKEIEVQTPMGETTCRILADQPVLATLLRAGLPLHQGLLNYFDKADNAFIGGYRKHDRDGSFEIDQQYLTSPSLTDRVLIISDPMLATGSSLLLALDTLSEYGIPSTVHVVTAIACTTGIELIARKYPDVQIWAGDVDDELTARGYIVPGLGDAGDLAYGNKLQG